MAVMIQFVDNIACQRTHGTTMALVRRCRCADWLELLTLVYGFNGSYICDVSRNMRFPTMWYVWPAKPQISLRICAV